MSIIDCYPALGTHCPFLTDTSAIATDHCRESPVSFSNREMMEFKGLMKQTSMFQQETVTMALNNGLETIAEYVIQRL